MPIYTEVSPGYRMNMRSNFLRHIIGDKTYQMTVDDNEEYQNNGEYQKKYCRKKGVMNVFS
jgi:hypothetical protein